MRPFSTPHACPPPSAPPAATLDRCFSTQAELEARLQLGETAEQRRLRERNRVEEADNDLTEDLFGGAAGGGRGGGGLSSVALKGMQVWLVAWVSFSPLIRLIVP